jgi:hypothetical protein
MTPTNSTRAKLAAMGFKKAEPREKPGQTVVTFIPNRKPPRQKPPVK